MSRTRRIVFVQLPHWDNDVHGQRENIRMAAAYLVYALERSAESAHWEPIVLDGTTDELDDRHLVDHLIGLRPDVVAATLYLWNVERTLHVLKKAKRVLPSLRVIVGGPEVAKPHPFLFRSRVPDVAVIGDGEAVLPEILFRLRTGTKPNLRTVGWRLNGNCFEWGKIAPEPVELSRAVPPADHPVWQPAPHGLAYLETSRGCPLRCSFCRYPREQRTMSFLPADEVIQRLRILQERGAREIRFVDPTFNAHPRFTELLRKLAAFNPHGRLSFFAELRAETVTAEQARLLRRANVREVEIGVQSLNRRVLTAVGRPTNLSALERGIRILSRHVPRVTLDIMCGLPYQTPADIRRCLRWVATHRHVHLQFLPTLLLPGTSLRRQRHNLGLRSCNRPPYRVTATRWMSSADILTAERLATRISRLAFDVPTRRFVGRSLPDLFDEKIEVSAAVEPSQWVPGGTTMRRAVLFRDADLFANRFRIAKMVSRSIRLEPFVLWQFVLCPMREEPLDIVDLLIQEIRGAPSHFLDSSIPSDDRTRLAARRVMILLAAGKRYDTEWVRCAESLLRNSFV